MNRSLRFFIATRLLRVSGWCLGWVRVLAPERYWIVRPWTGATIPFCGSKDQARAVLNALGGEGEVRRPTRIELRRIMNWRVLA